MNFLPAKSFRFEGLFETISDDTSADVRVADVGHPCCSPEWCCCLAAHFLSSFLPLTIGSFPAQTKVKFWSMMIESSPLNLFTRNKSSFIKTNKNNNRSENRMGISRGKQVEVFFF